MEWSERELADKQYSCDGKIQHPTMQKATIAAYALEQDYPDKNYEPYKCYYCGFYHIGKIKDRSMYDFSHRPEECRPRNTD